MMRDELAALIDPIIQKVGWLHEAATSEDASLLAQTRAEVRERLLRLHQFELADGRSGSADYYGLRYPLVCWIDELMTENPSVGRQWNENKLEGELYGTNDRAWMFWRQAALAETLARSEDLEVFYLCVNMGFTGQYRTSPDELAAWLHRTRVRLGVVPELELPFQHDLPPATDVPPLHGNAVLRRAGYAGWIAAVALLPALSYLAVASWNQ